MKLDLAGTIEHTLLKPDAFESDIEQLCTEAIKNDFFGVCVPPYFVGASKEWLTGSKVTVVTVVGFPLGYSTTIAKVEETKKATEQGADEIDMVMNIAAFKNSDWRTVTDDIESVVSIARMADKKLKLIIETGLLEEYEILKACELASEAEVDFVKTSTGFNGGATVEAVRLIRENLPDSIGIKASGGIRTQTDAEAMIKAGAIRIGTSAGIAIVKG